MHIHLPQENGCSTAHDASLATIFALLMQRFMSFPIQLFKL